MCWKGIWCNIWATLAVGRVDNGGGGGAGGGSPGGAGAGAYTRPLAQREHFLWDTLAGVSLAVVKTAQVELNRGRV
jgi:hypothetical protein